MALVILKHVMRGRIGLNSTCPCSAAGRCEGLLLYAASEASHVLSGARGSEGSERAPPEHVRTLQALLPRPEHLKHAPVPLGFIVEVRRLLCQAIPARDALRTYHLSAQDLESLPVCKVCSPGSLGKDGVGQEVTSAPHIAASRSQACTCCAQQGKTCEGS